MANKISELIKGWSTTVIKQVRTKWPLFLICGGIIFGSRYSLQRHYALKGAYPDYEDFVYKLESKLLDLKFLQRGPQKPTGKIGVLAIDEQSITKFGDWPFSRKYYGEALRNLKKLGVKVVGFDATFTDPQITRLADVSGELNAVKRAVQSGRKRTASQKFRYLERWLRESPGDTNFARAVGEVGNVVLGFFTLKHPDEVIREIGEDKSKYFVDLDVISKSAIDPDWIDIAEGVTYDSYQPRLAKGYAFKSNFPALNAANENFAFFDNNADKDAINRWVTLVENIEGHLFSSLGLKVAEMHLDRKIAVMFGPVGVKEVVMYDKEDYEANSIDIPVDPYGGGRLLVNHRGPGFSFKHYSLADAYFNTFSEEEMKELKGMSLLLGGTATGTQDLRANPFAPDVDGVENHAAVADNIIRGDFMRRTTEFIQFEWNLVLITGLLFAPLMIWGSSLFSGFAVMLFIGGFWYYDWTHWFTQGEWHYMAVPTIQIIGMFMITTFVKYVVEEREKKAVKGAFEHYLSPDVIEQVLDDPESMALGGVRKEITVFFSDVRSFTTISEGLTPEKLCEFMNLYFTPMTSIILEAGGTLDKYIGDAIMAFWGAPIANEHHAEHAAESSIKMLFALDKLRADFPEMGFPKPDIGIGLNTGSASVGNMGSGARFSYTAMGDAINLGARLEGLTKEYKIKLMISEFTVEKLSREKFFYRDLDDIRVKGKNEPVRVFELMRPDLVATEQGMHELVGEFELCREAYRQMDWNKAEKHATNCLNLRPDDGPAQLYMQRLAQYKVEPPAAAVGSDWDGVYTFTHK